MVSFLFSLMKYIYTSWAPKLFYCLFARVAWGLMHDAFQALWGCRSLLRYEYRDRWFGLVVCINNQPLIMNFYITYDTRRRTVCEGTSRYSRQTKKAQARQAYSLRYWAFMCSVKVEKA
jgi:hypothetical protein